MDIIIHCIILNVIINIYFYKSKLLFYDFNFRLITVLKYYKYKYRAAINEFMMINNLEIIVINL